MTTMRAASPRLGTFMFAAALCASVFACGRDWESSLSKGARAYREGRKDEGLALMEEAVVRGSSSAILDAPRAEGDAVLYRKSKAGIEIMHPLEMTLKGVPDVDAIACSPDTGITAIVRGSDLALFGPGGKFISADELPASKERERRARALAWVNDTPVLFADGKLYRYSPNSRAFTPLLPKEAFLPPYGDSSYRAAFTAGGGVLFLTVGLGGQYNLSAIAIEKDTLVFKNKPVSSSRIMPFQDRLYYIAGTAGAWLLAVYSFETKAVKELASFGDLVDVTLLTRGVLYETREGNFYADYAQPAAGVSVPFSFRPRGISGKLIVIEYGNSVVLADEKRFLELLGLAWKELPLVFAAGVPAKK